MAGRAGNPFHPQFGRRPGKFIGRDGIIRDFLTSLEDGNDPHRTTVVTGIRGSGKTALLSGVKEVIDKDGWLVVDVTAGSELNRSILDQMQLLLQIPHVKVTGGGVGALGFNLSLQTASKEGEHGFRYYLTLLVEECRKRKKGVVFLIDEIHNDTPDTREFVTSYQHLVRDDANIALLMAGLPRSVNAVLNDKILTFLHRAHKIRLQSVDARLVSRLYETTFKGGGLGYDEEALLGAAGATCGFPYLIQLIGYHLWKTESGRIDDEQVEDALLNSKVELFQNVYQIMLREASGKDREFLYAMLEDQGASRFGDITQRLGVSTGYASRYRQRLIESGFIEAAGYGSMAFVPPYFREFLESEAPR